MLIAWYSTACVPNNAAITADASSAPAANMVVVDPADATLAAPIVDPNRSKSDAATATISGATPTKDISHLPATRPWPAVTDTSKPCQATQHRAMVAARVTGGQGQNPPNQCAYQWQCAQMPTRGLPEKVGCGLAEYRPVGHRVTTVSSGPDIQRPHDDGQHNVDPQRNPDVVRLDVVLSNPEIDVSGGIA